MAEKTQRKILAQNRSAHHEFFIEEKYEAGIELFGTEVKSVRMGKVNLKESYCEIDDNGEMYILGMHISPYEKGNIFNKDPLRPKKVLMHKKEIMKLLGNFKGQFEKFSDLISKTQTKIHDAQRVAEQLRERSDMIQNKLDKVELVTYEEQEGN